MPLETGSRLGPYEIIALVGKGGMGEVYRARDPRVGRDVAIKISGERFTERFEREARTIAALNHPNVCTLFDVGPNFLVMEFVEGDSPQGPMPVEDALRISEQIAAALEAAHEKGIVHRDLKPGNIKVKPDGTVKVLDFGLAKVGGTPSASTEYSPTMSLAATQAGVVLGTAAYMSPEQARGKPVDHRADIWAFGVVLYELITGERLFRGEDVTEVVASVVKERPDLSAISRPARTLIEECLQKDPSKRLQSIADRRLLLKESPVEAVPPPVVRRGSRAWPVLAIALAVVAAVALWSPWRRPPEAQTVRFEINDPPKTLFTNWMSLSPDGLKVAFTARGDNGGVRIWVRSLESLVAKDIADTSALSVPFWSFDSRHIAYQYDGKLRRVDAAGGPSQVLCDASSTFMGGAWNKDGVIIFGGPDGLQRVSANGGSAEKLTAVDGSRAENGHAAPAFLRDGQRFIYQRRSSRADVGGIYIGSLDVTPDKQSNQLILPTDLNALYAQTSEGDKLLFVRESALMAQAFDADGHRLTGEAAQLANPVGRMTGLWINAMVAENGTLIYRTGGLAEQRQLVWYDRGGKVIETFPEPGAWTQVAVSRDGSRAAAQRLGDQGNFDLFVVDLAKALFTRFTFDKGTDADPIWSPDGKRIVFSSERGGSRDLYIKPANGTTNEELALKSPEQKIPSHWSVDGRHLLYSVRDAKNSWDIWVLPMAATDAKTEAAKPMLFLSTPAAEDQASLSPDGRFIAYRSNESGRNEVYVRSFPDGDGRWQISKNGGNAPRWRSDGKELFFTSTTLAEMAVNATLTPTVEFGVPVSLFTARNTSINDALADGQRFLWADTLDDQVARPIIVVLNALR